MGAEEPFPVAIDEEVNRTRRHDACEVGAEALEVRPPTFSTGDRDEDLHRFAPVEEGAAEEGKSGGWGDAACGAGVGKLGLVEVALETGAEDIERGGHESCGHPAQTVIPISKCLVKSIASRGRPVSGVEKSMILLMIKREPRLTRQPQNAPMTCQKAMLVSLPDFHFAIWARAVPVQAPATEAEGSD